MNISPIINLLTIPKDSNNEEMKIYLYNYKVSNVCDNVDDFLLFIFKNNYISKKEIYGFMYHFENLIKYIKDIAILNILHIIFNTHSKSINTIFCMFPNICEIITKYIVEKK